MSDAARKRAAHGRIQPYAWLGFGAVTLGVGAAMIGGTAVAFADTGSGSAGSSASTSGKTEAPRGAGNSARGNTANGSVSTAASSSPAVRNGRAPLAEPSPAADSTPVLGNRKPLPAAAVATGSAARASAAAVSSSVVAPTPAAAAAPAAATASPAADPPPSTESWLPVTPIVPGAHVTLAVQEIQQSQALIKLKTWGSGNILAGLGSFGPQAALATAQLLLGIWSSTIANAQSQVASTVGKPLIHAIAQARLQNEVTYTKLAGLSLQTASALITPLSWFGATVAPAQALVTQAQQDGKVYAKIPVKMVDGTEPIVNVKLNGGSNTKLLVDTGASGIVTTSDQIGNAALGPAIGDGNSCFSGGDCYHYVTYNMTVNLGDGATATEPVNIVTDIPGDPTYENSVANFKSFFSWGAGGILGVGANTAGPGPETATTGMPGELSDGVLIYENANPLGLGGYLILGPNLFPTKVSLPGAPDADVNVSINGGAQQAGAAIIDSGGVYGTLNRSLYPGTPTGDNVPAGTKIDVYAPDGTTLLYSYTTQGDSDPTTFIDSGLFNTGNAPYAQNPIYLNYGTTPYGLGSTDFSIY